MDTAHISPLLPASPQREGIFNTKRHVGIFLTLILNITLFEPGLEDCVIKYYTDCAVLTWRK